MENGDDLPGAFAGYGVIAFLVLHLQVGQSFRAFDTDFYLVPLSVALHVGRVVADAVLMPEFERDAGRGVFQLRARPGEEGLAARGLRYLLQDRLPLYIQRTARSAAYFDNPDAIYLHAGLLEQFAQFPVGVA